MRKTVSKRIVNGVVRYLVSRGLVYLNNAKVACSTVKLTMWRAADQDAGTQTYKGNPHTRRIDPFAKDVFAPASYDSTKLNNAVFFSVVRNPFVRVLSSYVDKIPRDPNVWLPFARRFGLRQDLTKDELTFRDFLVMVNSEPDELLDGHFRPQYMNLLWPICEPHFVGHLEKFPAVADFLSRHDMHVDRFDMHSTGARELIRKYYCKETIEIVRRKYADDFRTFGYSTEIAEVDECSPIERTGGSTELLTRWILQGIFPLHVVDEQTRTYEYWSRSTDPGSRIKLASAAYVDDDNWERLQDYAAHAIRLGEYKLAQDILDKIKEVTTGHRPLVADGSIFDAGSQRGR